jgi:hypothetical protein
VLPERIDQLHGVGNDLRGRMRSSWQGYDPFYQVDYNKCCFFLSIVRFPGIPSLATDILVKVMAVRNALKN